MKKYIVINILVVISLLGLQQYLIRSSPSKEDILLQKITGLELKIDSLNTNKDSIRKVINSTHVKIITNEKHYQKRINTIITQPADSDYEFVRAYARQHRAKRISNNMSGTREIEY